MNQSKLEVVKQEMARVNIDILGISELKWMGMGEFNSDDHYIYYCGQDSLRRNGVALIVNKRVQNVLFGCSLKNDRMISVCFQGKSFNITVNQVYDPATHAEPFSVFFSSHGENTHPLSEFQVHNTVLSTIVTRLYTSSPNPSCITATLHCWGIAPTSHPQAPATALLLSASMSWIVPDSTSKRRHAGLVLLWLVYFLIIMSSACHPCCHEGQTLLYTHICYFAHISYIYTHINTLQFSLSIYLSANI